MVGSAPGIPAGDTPNLSTGLRPTTMMATTHALAGLLVGAAATLVAPEIGTTALVAGFAGGFAPDLDMYWNHRRTLHFPVWLPVLAVLATLGALLVPSTTTVAIAVFLAAAALHSVSDVIGGGLELRPWHATSDKGVYSHYHGTWIAPRHWIGWDGSPGDLALASVLALPALSVTRGTDLATLVTAAILVSLAYTLVRKRLPALAEGIEPIVPTPIRPYVPERYR